MEKAVLIDIDEYASQQVVEPFLPNFFSGHETKHVSDKTLHERYWTSWEEQKLIELWRKYKTDIPTFDEHSPVFRAILDEMKRLGFQLTSRECRRRIITLKNKYFAEKKKLEVMNSPTMESKWPLYQLIDVVIKEGDSKVNINHEMEVVDELLAELNLAAPEYLQQKEINIEATPDIFKNVEQEKTARPTVSSSSLNLIGLSSTDCRSIVPIRRVTREMIKSMKKDIESLEQNRDNELNGLKHEQNEYYHWLSVFEKTQRELEQMLTIMGSRITTNQK